MKKLADVSCASRLSLFVLVSVGFATAAGANRRVELVEMPEPK
jgi:hypothetical protein